MADPVEKTLHLAAQSDHLSEVLSLLKDHPGLNVNWGYHNNWTALHFASLQGHGEVVKALLAHPDINVNVKDSNGTNCRGLCLDSFSMRWSSSTQGQQSLTLPTRLPLASSPLLRSCPWNYR